MNRGCCGVRTFPDEAKALRVLGKITSLRETGGGSATYSAATGVYRCRGGNWHLEEPEATTPAKLAPAAKDTGPETFPRPVCLLIDKRDSDDSGAVLVRLCQRCGTTRNLHRHHRRLKGYGGSRRTHAHCACVGVTLCQRCHGEIHANPKQAMTEGWIVSRAVRHPGTVGVMRFAAAEGGATQWPTCTGEWAETAPEAREAA